jgi:hypothetical protein
MLIYAASPVAGFLANSKVNVKLVGLIADTAKLRRFGEVWKRKLEAVPKRSVAARSR